MRERGSLLRSALVNGLGLADQRMHATQFGRGIATMTREMAGGGSKAIADRLSSADPDDPLWFDVAPYFTVNESWFLRNRPWFTSILHAALAPILAARRADGRREVELWSIGCARGAEAYSLLMATDALVDPKECWEIRVSAFDVSASNVAMAQGGRFTKRELRELTASEVKRWFSPLPDGAFQITPKFMSRARINLLNLAGSLGSLDSLPVPDFVMCRNVLMYLSDATQERLMAMLARRLPDGSGLAVAPAEGSIVPAADFIREPVPGGMLHRRCRNAAGRPVRPAATAASLPRRFLPSPATGPAALREEATVRDAASLLVDAVPVDTSMHVDHWRIRAALAEESGDFEAAADARRRIVYLAPDAAGEHYLLGCVLHRLGRREAAERCFQTTLALLDARREPREGGAAWSGAEQRLCGAAMQRLAAGRRAV